MYIIIRMYMYNVHVYMKVESSSCKFSDLSPLYMIDATFAPATKAAVSFAIARES